MKSIWMFSASGFSKENYGVARRCGLKVAGFVEKDKQPAGLTFDGLPIICEDDFGVIVDPPEAAIISVGDPKLKEKIYNNIISKFPDCEFPNAIDPSCVFLIPESIKFGKGVILHAWCLATYNVTFGDFCQSGSGLIIGHDCVVGDYGIFGIAASIAGHATIGKSVRIGSNVATREGTTICDNVTLGVGAVVVKDITEPGVYIGNPAKKLVKEK